MNPVLFETVRFVEAVGLFEMKIHISKIGSDRKIVSYFLH